MNERGLTPLTLTDVLVEHGLHVNDWGSVQYFQLANAQPPAVDGGHLDTVQANGVGAMGRPPSK